LTFFSKNLTMAILFKKMTIFVKLKKKSQAFGNFLTFKWQFSGGSDSMVERRRWVYMKQSMVEDTMAQKTKFD